MCRSRLVHAVVVVALLFTGWFLFAERVLAIQDSEDKVWFGPVGVGAGQAARINVYGLDSSGGPVIAPAPALPWEFTVRIFNRRGEAVRERRFQAAPGAITSLEIFVQDEEDFPVDRLGRRTLRAEIAGFNPQPDPPGTFAATLEVYSQLTGHTIILLGGAHRLPALSPPPDPDSHQ
jgi:hypothetical protein